MFLFSDDGTSLRLCFIHHSRCLLRDKEVACREKDSQIRDLKGKVVNLSSLCRKLEMQNAELAHQVKSQVSVFGYHRFMHVDTIR